MNIFLAFFSAPGCLIGIFARLKEPSSLTAEASCPLTFPYPPNGHQKTGVILTGVVLWSWIRAHVIPLMKNHRG